MEGSIIFLSPIFLSAGSLSGKWRRGKHQRNLFTLFFALFVFDSRLAI